MSGTLISASNYLRLLGEGLQSGVNRTLPGGGTAIRDQFAGFAEESRESGRKLDAEKRAALDALPEGEHLSDEESEKYARRYVNLKDARILGHALQIIEVGLWRGRLSQVDGWHLGTLNVGPA